MRDIGYPGLTNDQLWYYHAYDYGWRRAYLNQADQASPIDMDGTWFNALMADKAEAFFKQEQSARRKDPHVASSARDAYARSAGFKSWADRHQAIIANKERYRLAEVWRQSPEAQLDPAIAGKAARKPQAKPSAASEALGVTAREYTADELAAGRRELGLEPPEAAA